MRDRDPPLAGGRRTLIGEVQPLGVGDAGQTVPEYVVHIFLGNVEVIRTRDLIAARCKGLGVVVREVQIDTVLAQLLPRAARRECA